jgi:hypothetical protein
MKKLSLVAAILLAVVLIGQAVLHTRRTSLVTNKNSQTKPTAEQPALQSSEGARAQLPDPLVTKQGNQASQPTAEQLALQSGKDARAQLLGPLVTKRGKQAKQPEEKVLYAESSLGEAGKMRMARESEEEREGRKGSRKGSQKNRYAFAGQAAATQTASNTPPPVNNRPKAQNLIRAGSSFTRDMRTLRQTKPVRRERPEREGPAFNPREITREGQKFQPLQQLRRPLAMLAAPAPDRDFDGLDRFNWGAGSPSDVNGDVGPTYYIQSVNTSVGIFRKSDGFREAAFTFDTLMAQGNFGNQCDTQNFGDPVVLYDTFEDRWVLTDFAFTLDGGGNVSPQEAFQCFAVSKTGDPLTGGWNFYSIRVTDGLNDYPKLGVWTDGIYMSANMFGFAAGASFQTVRTWAFNKAQMYAGAPTAQSVSFDIGGGDFTVIPSNARLQTGTPPPGRPNLFVSTQLFLNALTVYKFQVDWNSPSLSTLTGPDVPLTGSSWPNALVANAPQPGTATLLDTLGIRAMVQNQYTNLGGTESLWATHTVRRANTTGFAAPRWYQVNVTGGTVATPTVQTATWDPDAANVLHRFMPSLALDRAGNMAVGYSTSSSTVFPSIAYAGRLAADPINTFSLTEQALFTGTASQTGTARWGDYSSMTLDPDGCRFWFTSQYANPASQDFDKRWLTRINSFSYASIGQCTPVGAGGTVAGTVRKLSDSTPISGATVELGARSTTTDGAGQYSFLNIPAGTYPTMSASAPGYVTATAANIVVTDGGTTTQDFSLATAPVAACLTDTTQSDFLTGVPTNVDLTISPGDVVLTKPDNLDQQNTTVTNSGFGFNSTSWAGQTFTAALSGQATKIELNLFCSGCTGTTPNLTVAIRATTGSPALPTGADLATATIPGFNTGAGGFFTATFSTPATLTAGTVYALIIRATANPSAGTYAYVCSCTSPNSNPYTTGQRVTSANSGGTWAADVTSGGRDLGFKVYVNNGYVAAGNLVSSTKDANPAVGATPHWTTLSWNATTPANTAVQFQVAGSNNEFGPFNFVGPDTTAGTFFTTSGASLSQFDGLRYLQYKAYLNTTDSTMTPTLHDVTACFSNITGTLSGGGTICAGGSTNVIVTVNGGTPPYTVILTNGGGTQTGAGPVFTFPVSPGSDTTYMLAAGSVDANTNPIIGSGSATVTVTPTPPTPTITPGGPTTFCAGGSVTLTSSSATGNQWYLNGNPIGGATNQAYVATAAGNYTVIVTTSGCSSAPSAATTVTVNPAPPTPTITPGGPTTFCMGGSVTLTSSSASGNQWYLNGNPIGGETNQTYVATASGNYTVIVTASGCASSPSAPMTVTVNPTPPTPTITPGGPTTFCAGGNVSLTSSSATGNQWYLNGNPIGGATNQTYVATASGNYTVVVTTSGCSSSPSTPTTVTVNPAPPTPTITPSGSQTLCASGNVTLTSSSATGNQWYLNGNPIGGATNQTYVATVAGSYTVVVTTSGCSSAPSAPTVVSANTPPVLSYNSATVGAGTTPTIPPATGPSDNGTITSIVLQSIVPNNGGLAVNVNNVTGQVQVTSATIVGNYTVTIVATDNCNATTTATLAVSVACPAITISPATLPNGVQGTAYNQSLTASPAVGNYTYAVTTNVLPSGLSLNSTTGAITGTPTAVGNYTFVVTVTNSGGCTKAQSYNIIITGTCTTITLSPATLPAATLGTAYNQTVTAAGGVAPYTFSVSSGALPLGLTLDANTGALTGTPTAGGTFAFTIKATGQGGCFGTRSYVISVTCATLTFNPASLPNGAVGLAYNQPLTITQAGTYTFSLLVGSLPPGFTLSNAGVLSGITNQPGTYNFTVKAVGGTCQGTKAYTLVIGSSQAALAQLGDYDGDGKSDFALWSNNGTWRLLLSTGGANRQAQTQSWGTTGDLSLLGDYDGDGLSDLAVFRPANGTWYVKRSTNGSFLSKVWGAAGDVPVPGDYDGDGKTDLAVFRPSDGNWYVLRSSDQQYEVVAWGSGLAPYLDVPVPGDYDGDGRTDLAVFRRANGTWLVRLSGNGQFLVKQWGLGTDVPVVADYDGDGRTDIAVWRTGAWYIVQSTTGISRVENWGTSAAPYFDQVTPGDYDGDGQADITVWRAGEQAWYVRCSVDGSMMKQAHGLASDVTVSTRPR